MKKVVLVILVIIVAAKSHSQATYAPEPTWYKTYDVKFYSINLDVNDTSTFIKGNTAITLLTKEATDSIVFEFNPKLKVDSVLLGRQKVNFVFRSDLLVLKSTSKIATESLVNVDVYYNGNAGGNSFFSSVSNEKNSYWNIPVTWSLSEPFGAKLWFPCKQQLTDKADSCHVFLNVPKDRKAGSVGVLTDTVLLANNKVQFRWKTRYPIAFYLISFTVADYKDYSFYARLENNKDSVLVQNYIYNRQGFLSNNKTDIDRTASFLKLFSKLFGEYPFIKEKYGHCVAPIGGGMEHQTMTTLVNFGFTLVSHELAHQWFGNKTTCASWQDIWINEGFASYAEYLAYEHLGSKSDADSWMLSAQNRALREPDGSVFLQANEVTDENRIFSTNLSYKKGAVILHMFRYHINNDSLFFKTLRQFLNKYPYASATGNDFKNVAEQVTGIDFDPFFNQWYYGKGYPIFDISWKMEKDSLLLRVSQSGSSKSTPFFATPFEIKVVSSDFDTILRFSQTINHQVFKVKVSKPVNNIEFDPGAWLLKSVQSITQLPEIPSEDKYFEIQPNPFNNQLKVIFTGEPLYDEKISLISMNGNVVVETLSRKKKELNLNTSQMPAGTYLIVVTHGSEKYVRKITKAFTF